LTYGETDDFSYNLASDQVQAASDDAALPLHRPHSADAIPTNECDQACPISRSVAYHQCMTGDTEQNLIRAYARNRSEEAFGELVHRHVDLVHSNDRHRFLNRINSSNHYDIRQSKDRTCGPVGCEHYHPSGHPAPKDLMPHGRTSRPSAANAGDGSIA
jgi:hypothetical protein